MAIFLPEITNTHQLHVYATQFFFYCFNARQTICTLIEPKPKKANLKKKNKNEEKMLKEILVSSIVKSRQNICIIETFSCAPNTNFTQSTHYLLFSC